MHDTDLEALARQAFPATTHIIILDTSDPGGTLFHDADAEFQAAGIAATSRDEATRTIQKRIKFEAGEGWTTSFSFSICCGRICSG